MVASLTLLPSLLAIFGSRLESGSASTPPKQKAEPGDRWRRWADWSSAVRGLRWSWRWRRWARSARRRWHAARLRRRRQRPPEHHQPAGLRPARRGIRPGANGPLVGGDRGRPRRPRRTRLDDAGRTDGVADGDPAAGLAGRGDAHRWRSRRRAAGRGDHRPGARPARRAAPTAHLVGGPTAAVVDFSDAVGERLPLFVARGGRALGAAAAAGVPLGADPDQGRGAQPAVDRRVAGRDHAGLPATGVRRAARADRGVRAGDDLRDRLRAVDGLRGVPGLPHARGVGAHPATRRSRSARGWRPPAA